MGTIRIASDAMSVEDVLDLCIELSEPGIEHVIFNMPDTHEIEPVRIIGREVIPQVANLP